MNNLREIQALRRLSPHAHIIKLLEVLYDQPTGRLALVFELMVGTPRQQQREGEAVGAAYERRGSIAAQLEAHRCRTLTRA